MSERLQGLRDAWDNLSEREQRLLAAMGAVAGALLLGSLILMTNGALADVQEERDELRKVLADIETAGPTLDQARLEKQERDARYRNAVPALGSYIEEKATTEGIELRQVVDQPDEQLGKYERTHIRVRFNNVSLRPLMRLISSIYDGNKPVAIEQLHIEHYRPGDQYNVKLGVYAYAVSKKAAKSDDKKEED